MVVKNKRIINNIKNIITIVTVLIIISSLGFSISYFNFEISSEEKTINTSNLALSFDDKTNIINNENIFPINQDDIFEDATKKSFSITNTGTDNMYINLSLKEISIDEELKDKYFRFALYDKSTNSIISLGMFDKTTNEQVIIQNILLEKITKNYDLYIWIEDSGLPQNNMMDKKFSGKIVVEGFPKETIIDKLITNTNTTTIENNKFLCENCDAKINGNLDLSYLTNLNTIYSGSFKGNGITSIELPISLKSLSGFSNNNITGVVDLSYLTNLESIGSYTFDSNQISKIILPTSLETISSNAFYNNNITGELDLSYLTNLKSISTSAFQYNSITCVKLPNTLTFDNVKLAFDSSVVEC